MDFRTHCVIMTLGGGGIITNDVLKFKKNRISKLTNCDELSMNCVLVYYQCSVRVLLQHIYKGKLSEKIILLQSLYLFSSNQVIDDSLYISSHQNQAHLYKYKTIYKVQICCSKCLENKLFIFLNYEFFFFSGSKNKQTKTKPTRQRKLEISNYNIQLQFQISSYIQFYCFLYYMYVICKYNR